MLQRLRLPQAARFVTLILGHNVPQIPEIAMTDTADQPAPDSRESWLSMMERLAEDSGYFDPLGDRHFAFFVDESPTLIVSFEAMDDIRARPDQLPLGHAIAAAHGWSHLCLICDGETWFRDPRVYGYFDRLVDDAFFEDFDRVVFMGADVQGYAAAAFSVAAPGCSVLAISPRATMTPAIAGWDRRAPKARRLDFTSRYGFAPDMIEAAGAVFVIHDPEVATDAMHAALFRGPHVTHLHAPRLEGRVDWALSHMQLHAPLVDQLVAGTLTPASWGRLWRARRNFGPYLRIMLARADASGRVAHAKGICQSVTQRLQAPRFRKRLADILADEAATEADAALAATSQDA